MDTVPPELTVVYTRQANRELEEIWEWNAEENGANHATDYILFLESSINSLATRYTDGRTVKGFPGLRRLNIKRRRDGHYHIAIYEVDQAQGVVRVLHIYHERQDISGRLRREGR